MSSQPLNIIRIKRKANDAPLAALVVDTGDGRASKRSRKEASGVFRLAQTVSSDWQGRGAEGKALMQHVQSLMAEPQLSSDESQPEAGPSNRRFQIVRKALAGRRIASIGSRLAKSAESSRESTPIRFIDARPEPGTPSPVAAPSDAIDDAGDVKMQDLAKFLPMLEAKAAAPRRNVPVPIGPPPATPPNLTAAQRSFVTSTPPSRRMTPVVQEEDGDWVVDLYYLSTEAPVTGAAVLSGLDQFLDEENDPGSDSEEGDEADEDSNSESYYAADYPEDEDEASGDERWAHDRRARNGFVYGDELDDDRDGFDTDEEPVHPLHKPIGRQRVPGLEDESEEDDDESDGGARWRAG